MATMASRKSCVALLGLALLPSCSFIVGDDWADPPPLDGSIDAAVPDAALDAALPDATVDAAVVDAAVADAAIDVAVHDANGDAITVSGVQPNTPLEEGATYALLFTGNNITSDVVVAANDTGVTINQSSKQVSTDSTRLTIQVTIPPDGTRGEAAPRSFQFTFTHGTSVVNVGAMIQPRDELTLAAGNFNGTLRARYSRVTLSNAVTFRGNGAPIRIVSNGDISISANVDGSADLGTPGRGGCVGGVNQGGTTAAGCGTSGGSQGSNAPGITSAGQGGAGGGHAAVGNNGSGATGGAMAGDVFLAKLGNSAADESRGNGGGAGGSGGVGNAGAGGAGGGTIELTAGGTLRVEADILTNGGAGSSGTGLLACATAGGQGGGGSGGALLLRAAGGLTVVGSRTLSSQGGAAGTPGSCTNIGGSGSSGRIRIDAPAATITGLTATPAARRGPMWAASTPLMVTSQSQTFTLIGAPSQQYFVVIADMGAMMPFTTDVSGMVNVQVPSLPLGHSRICALVPGATFNANSEGQNCRTVLVFAP